MKKFINNLKISHALIFITIVVTASILLLSYLNISNLKKSGDFMAEITNDHLIPILQMDEVLQDYEINIFRTAHKVNIEAISWEDAYTKIQQTRQNIANKRNAYPSSLTSGETGQKIIAIDLLSKKADITLDKLEQALSMKNEVGLIDLLSTELPSVINPITDALRSLIDKEVIEVENIKTENTDLYNSAFVFNRNFDIIALLIIVFFSFFIIGTISRSLKNANDFIKRISEGDLTVSIHGFGRDEIGQLMFKIKGLVRNLKNVIEIINAAANNIAITSHELSTNSQLISEGASEQAASVEEMAASMQEISANIIQNAKNAKVTEQISAQAGSEFDNGRENIDKTVDSIKTIASKISIIDEIAFQTNILALNAAVEAARAGEHGKGFGVVAAEVGKLAERSKIAAAEIDMLSKSGVDLSLKSKDLLKLALPSISKTILLVKEISQASSEQSTGVNQINSGIQTLNQVTQQNAASSEEMATVAEEMAAQAEQLSNSISFFNIGNSRQPKTTAKPAARKYLQQKSNIRTTNKNIQKGIDLNMDNQDDLDNEFETF